MPKVSVIIPVYNVEKYLRECLDSVVNQTLKDIEIICVDDGSTDSSLKILKEYAKRDARITVLSQKNQNAGAARNAGLDIAKGEYLSFLDSDDFFEPDMLEKAYNHSKKYNTDVTMFDFYLFNSQENKDISGDWTLKYEPVKDKDTFNYKDIPNDILTLSNCWAWNRLFRTDFVKTKGLRFQSLKCTNDTYFSCIAMVEAERIAVLNERLLHYRTKRKKESKNVTSVSYRQKSPTDLLFCFYSIYQKLVSMEIYTEVEYSFMQVATEHMFWSRDGIMPNKKAYQKFCSYFIAHFKDLYSKLYYPFKDNILRKKYSVLRNILIDEGVINEIPKRIFYVWGANEPKRDKVQKCIDTWKKHLPDYEIVEINENSREYFNFKKELKNNKWFRTVYNKKMWAYVSDYIRIKTLYNHGGIYFDTDVSVLKNMDEFLSEPAFVGIQRSSLDSTNDLVEPAILGAQKNNNFLGQVLDFYNKKIWQEPIYNMPQIFNYYLRNYPIFPFPKKEEQEIIKLEDITIYPEKYFIPYRYGTEFSEDCISPETYTIHHWNASWLKPEILNFLKNKHKLTFKLREDLKQIFSAENIRIHKVITIFGIKMKFKIKRLEERERFNELNQKIDNLGKELQDLKQEVANVCK